MVAIIFWIQSKSKRNIFFREGRPVRRRPYWNPLDLSSLYFDPDYEGLMDYVVIAGLVRSPMGVFQALYGPEAKKRWNMPKEKDIAECKVAAVDPYFMEETQAVVNFCKKYNKPYVTIDSRHDTDLHKYCAVEVRSTLGAGDTFKAGCVYGLLKGMTDEELVRFASACSAIAISRFPLPLNPPTLDEVNGLLEK